MQNRSLHAIDSLVALDDRLWRTRLVALALRAQGAAPDAQAGVLGEARRLLALMPPSEAERVGRVQGKGRIDAMLAAGAFESAAMALLPERAAFMLSRGEGDQPHLATVLLPAMADEVTAPAASGALALVAALAEALAGPEAAEEIAGTASDDAAEREDTGASCPKQAGEAAPAREARPQDEGLTFASPWLAAALSQLLH